jgi:catechol 2,3-dioxygenase-like lactoylglutathione lyase family enzyme
MSDTSSENVERPKFGALHHVSLPCRDSKEAISFYCELLGAELIHEQWGFFLVSLGGTYIGISSEGASWMEPENEYPHIAWSMDADSVVKLRELLPAHGVPVSPCWTRDGSEALMFFRDPSGNMLELFCAEGYPGAADLPTTWKAQGHSNVMNVEDTVYENWKRPETNKLATTSEPPMKEEFSETVY